MVFLIGKSKKHQIPLAVILCVALLVSACTPQGQPIVFTAGAATAISAEKTAAPPLPSQAELEELLRRMVEDERRAPGMVVGFISPKGRVVAGYGVMNANDPRKVDGDTVFQIGSVTKTFTATLLAQELLAGKLRLDDPLAKLVGDEFELPEYQGQPVTLRHAATHTSGLPRDWRTSEEGEELMSKEDIQQLVAESKLTLAPGTQYGYSNIATSLVAYGLSRKAGTSYEELAKSRIWEPLGMTSTGITFSPVMEEHRAAGHNAAFYPVADMEFGFMEGAGAIRSTANDMLTYLAAASGLVETPLLPAFQYSMQPLGSNSDFFNTRMGLFWWLTGSRDFIVWHGGATIGFQTFAGYDPATRTGVVVWANANTLVEDIGLHLLQPRSYTISKRTPVFPAETAEVDAALFKTYAGRYEYQPGQIYTVLAEDGRLFFLTPDDEMLEMVPINGTTFYIRENANQISFHVVGGKAQSLTARGEEVNEMKRIEEQPGDAP